MHKSKVPQVDVLLLQFYSFLLLFVLMYSKTFKGYT